MKRFSVALLAVFLLFGCAHQGLEQTGAWTPASPAAGVQARYIDDAIRTNNTAIDAVFGTMLTAGTAVTSTAAELNILDGVTSSAAELNILDGVTSSAAELNILDGVTSSTAELNILDGVTSSTAELNILDGVTSSAAELNILDGVTATAAELNVTDGVLATAAEINEAADGSTHTTFSAGGDLTGTIYIARVGKIATMSWPSMSHSASASASSSAGAIPAAYRPATGVRSVFWFQSDVINKVSITTSGTITFGYSDFAAAAASENSTQSGTISWVIP